MLNYHTVVLISHASKVMLKILQARLEQYMNHKLPDDQAGFRKVHRVDSPQQTLREGRFLSGHVFGTLAHFCECKKNNEIPWVPLTCVLSHFSSV